MINYKCHLFLLHFLSNRDELANSLMYKMVLFKTLKWTLEEKIKNKNKESLLVKFQTRKIFIYSAVFERNRV